MNKSLSLNCSMPKVLSKKRLSTLNIILYETAKVLTEFSEQGIQSTFCVYRAATVLYVGEVCLRIRRHTPPQYSLNSTRRQLFLSLTKVWRFFFSYIADTLQLINAHDSSTLKVYECSCRVYIIYKEHYKVHVY